MFTGTPEELAAQQALAKEYAERLAALLNEMEEAGVGPLSVTGGQIATHGGIVRTFAGEGWSVSNR